MHAMIDLETMGTAYNAPIIAIGAAVFDPIGGKIQGDFYAGIALDDALAHGVLKGDTLAWWMKQSDVARMHAISGTMPLREALLTFTAFFRSHVGALEILRCARLPHDQGSGRAQGVADAAAPSHQHSPSGQG